MCEKMNQQKLPGPPKDTADIRRYLIPLVLAWAVSVAVFAQTSTTALTHAENFWTFNSLELGIDVYRKTIRQEWRPRLFSNYLASHFVVLLENDQKSGEPDSTVMRVNWPDVGEYAVDTKRFRAGLGMWVATWLFLTNIVFILAMKERSVVYVLGTYAAVSMGYTLGLGDTEIYPWDTTSLFCYAVGIALIHKGKYAWLAFCLPIFVGFKETTLVLSVALLFWPEAPLRRRLTYFVGAVAAAVLVKAGIDWYTDNFIFFTMTTAEVDWSPGQYRLKKSARTS